MIFQIEYEGQNGYINKCHIDQCESEEEAIEVFAELFIETYRITDVRELID